MKRIAGRAGRSLVSVALIAGHARAAAAQGSGSLADRLNLDKLVITSLGLSTGYILSSQLEPTTIYAITADYGAFAPSWHVVVGGSYWASRFRDDVVQAFVDTLNKNLSDPSGKAGIAPSRISLYDVTFSGEVRYTPVYSGEIKPYLGIGLAAHVINAEGSLIKGTFVERSLDAISVGSYVTAGLALKVVGHLGVDGSVRGDLLSGFRSMQARGGVTYYFGRLRRLVPLGDEKR